MKKYQYLLQPLVFALYFPMMIYLDGNDLVLFRDIVRSLVICAILAFIINAVFYKLYHDRIRASIASSIFWVLFFSYGLLIRNFPGFLANTLHQIIDSSQLFTFVHSIRNQVVLLLILSIFYAGTVIFLKQSRHKLYEKISRVITFIALVFVITVLYQSGEKILFRWRFHNEVKLYTDGIVYSGLHDQNHSPERFPNIYYIILDGYARSDILQDIYAYDNSGFMQFLENHNFYIARESQSNYGFTIQSLASSLNFMYLDHIAGQVGQEHTSYYPLVTLIQNNRLMDILETYGYSTIAYHQGFPATDLHKVDAFLSPGIYLNDFEDAVISITPLKLLFRDIQYNLHREKIIYTLNMLPSLVNYSDPPVFAFAHIYAPHPPFVFHNGPNYENPDIDFQKADGKPLREWMTEESYIEYYRDQVKYVTENIEIAIDEILNNSAQPAIIIIQSDHGSRMMMDSGDLTGLEEKEQFSILNAYYFPDSDYSRLYPQISPVNTFRVILNQYFGMNYQLLDDRSYDFNYFLPLDFTDITGILNLP